MKSMNMTSRTGRRPDCAAPIATPQIAPSLIGVFSTRSAPNSSASPAVVPYGPPSATSSPITNTLGSSRIARASAAFSAFRYVVFPEAAPAARCAGSGGASASA